MTTFLTITTSDKLVGDTPPSLSEKMLVQPRQTMVSDVQTQTSSMNSQTPSPSASSTLSTLSKATATSTTTTAPILRTIDGVVYFRTSMPALDVIGTPVTTLRQGDPVRPIAVWNATQAHGYEVSGQVGQWAALGVLAGFGLLFLVLSLAESIGFIRRRISGNTSSDNNDDDDAFMDTKKGKTARGIPLSDSAIPLTVRTRTRSAAGSPRMTRRVSGTTTPTITPAPTTSTTSTPTTRTEVGTGTGIGDPRSRRLSTYTPLPPSNLADSEPYETPVHHGFEAPSMENRASRYYSDGRSSVG